jgi:ATP-dependent DNA helicase RecQ
LLPPLLRHTGLAAAGRATGVAAATASFQGGLRAPANAGGAGAAHDTELDACGLALFEALRAFRLAEARSQKVPPYVIASDRSLRDIARLRPTTLGALELAHGIGPAKVERYGAAVVAIVKQQDADS